MREDGGNADTWWYCHCLLRTPTPVLWWELDQRETVALNLLHFRHDQKQMSFALDLNGKRFVPHLPEGPP